jgi:phage FluMu gp28-like protein
VDFQIPLTDWQRGFLDDEAQFRFLVAARQSGKSHCLGADSVLGSLTPGPSNLEVVLSRGQRQSLEVMQKCKMFCQALSAIFHDDDPTYFEDTSLLQHSVTFPDGRRIVALPANPDTARGYSGNLKLDEFGIHANSDEIWRAAAPIATRGFRITVASTYKGTNNKFYQIGKDLGLADGVQPGSQPVRKSGWSGHYVDVRMAAEQNLRTLGLRLDVEQLRQALGDEEMWQQEYLNIPISGADEYIPQELVFACEDDEVASLEWDGKPRPGLCAGWDFARKRDRSVIVIGYEVAGLVVVCGIKWLDRLTFAQQESAARPIVEMVQGCGGTFSMDAGGNGAQIAETLQKAYTCVDAVQFGGAVETGARNDKQEPIKELVKLSLARNAKRRFEERTFRIPEPGASSESLALRRAVRAIKRTVSPSGNVIIDAARTESGHGDEFWALVLLNAACAGSTGYMALDDDMVGGTPVLSGFMGKVF